jgi:hypothetical protein
MSIFDESAPFTYSPYTYPDNVTGANVAFNIRGAYQQNSVEIKLSTDGGELRVGMKKTISTTYDWTCFDNARLYYRKGIDTDGIESYKQIDSNKFDNIHKFYDLTGRQLPSQLKEGIYIQNGRKVAIK